MEESIIITDNVSEIRGSQKRGRRRRDFILGLFFTVLAFIGVITLGTMVYNTTMDMLNNTKQKQQWEEFILPVLLEDPVPFEDVSNMGDVRMKNSLFWAVLLNNSIDTFQRDELDQLLVPAAEVERQMRLLFGTNTTMQHSTIGLGYSDRIVNGVFEASSNRTIYFDPATQTYHIKLPEFTTYDAYAPKVTRIEKQGDELILVVGYVPPQSAWEKKAGEAEKIDKYFLYVIKTDKSGNDYLAAVRDIPTDWQEANPQDVSSLVPNEQPAPLLPDQETVSAESTASQEEEVA